MEKKLIISLLWDAYTSVGGVVDDNRRFEGKSIPSKVHSFLLDDSLKKIKQAIDELEK